MVLEIHDSKSMTFGVEQEVDFQKFAEELAENKQYDLFVSNPENTDEETIAIFKLEENNVTLKIYYDSDVEDQGSEYDFELEYRLSASIPEVNDATDQELANIVRTSHDAFESFTQSGRKVLQEGWGIEHELRSI